MGTSWWRWGLVAIGSTTTRRACSPGRPRGGSPPGLANRHVERRLHPRVGGEPRQVLLEHGPCLERASADTGRGHFLFERRLSDWKFETRAVGDGGRVYLANHVGGGEGDYPARWRPPLLVVDPRHRQELHAQAGRVALSRGHPQPDDQHRLAAVVRALRLRLRGARGEVGLSVTQASTAR